MAGPTTYRGINTESKPKAISWKKNPSLHIAKSTYQRRIKIFTQKKSSFSEKKQEDPHKSLIERE